MFYQCRFILPCVFLISMPFMIACGHSSDEDGYDCGGPKEEAIAGKSVNRQNMKNIGQGAGVANTTEPSEVEWEIKETDEGYSFKLAELQYYLYLNGDNDGWQIKLSKDDDQIFGDLAFFVYTVDSAIDSSHCGTTGYKFEVEYEGNKESFRRVHHIL
jgi:hypothetical protein